MRILSSYNEFSLNEDYVFFDYENQYRLKKYNSPFNLNDEVYIVKKVIFLFDKRYFWF